jgi:two-component system nitrogen regulation response regulator GlnG
MEFKRPVEAISEDAVRVLLGRRWPGNVRELKNAVRRAVLLATDVVRPEHLAAAPAGATAGAVVCAAPWTAPGATLREAVERAVADAERAAIHAALRAAAGNKSHAARLLRTDFKTLHVKMKRYGIAAEAPRLA